MKKSTYIKLSHQEANLKIWSSLLKKHNSLKQNNILLGYSWFILASIVYGFIAIFGWFSYLTVFFQDIRFTPHYLRTVIEYDKMTISQANAYLDSQMDIYKKSLSHGHFSLKRQSSIEATFELLYKEFKLPEQSHNEILPHIETFTNTVSDNISELKQIVSEGNAEIKNVSEYTKKKESEKIAEEIRIQNLKEEQKNKKKADYNRESGRMLNTFEPDLSDKQMEILTNFCNQTAIFTRNIEKWELEDILFCVHKDPLQVDVNKHIALLFNELKENNLICNTWMSVAERYNCFISKQGKSIVSKDLSMALKNSSTIKKNVADDIEKAIEDIISI